MAITVKIEEKQDKEITFPCLMQSKRTGLVVLFTGYRAGVVCKRDSHCIYSGLFVGYMG